MEYGGGYDDSTYSSYTREYADWYDDVYAGVFDSIGHGYGSLEDKYRESTDDDEGNLSNHQTSSYRNSSAQNDTLNQSDEYQNTNGSRGSVVFLSATLCDLGGCRIVTAKPRDYNEGRVDQEDITNRDKGKITRGIVETMRKRIPTRYVLPDRFRNSKYTAINRRRRFPS